MAKYIINYNPYKNTVIVEKNDCQLKKNSAICKGIDGKRLQTWFDETNSWAGIGKVLDLDNNESTCEIVFIGREIDYIDLKDYFTNIYKSDKGTEFLLSAKNLSSDEDMLARLSNLVTEAKSSKLFPKKQLQEIEQHITKLQTEPFVISVIATMSSGKSTLLNALMHRELLPTGDRATTANVVEIYDNDEESISYKTYDKDGNLINESDDADLNTFVDINNDDNIRTVKVFTDIPMVSAERMPLLLRDTPGPNNSKDPRHKQITEDIISDARNMSTVLYIMSALQLRVDSDYELLESISVEMRNGGKQANDRFLFVINRVDDWIQKPGQSLEGLLDEAKDYLQEFGIDNPRIFLVTASLASNIWKSKNGYEFGNIEKRTFSSMIELFNDDEPAVKFDKYASISKCVAEEIERDLKNAISNNDQKEIALVHSGFRGLEYSIKEYMEKYAYPIKVSDAIQDIVDTIDEKKMKTKFFEAIMSDDRKLENVKRRIKEGETKKAERLAKKKQFEESIQEYGISESLRSEANQSVNDAFSDVIDKYTSKVTSQKLLKQSVAVEMVNELQIEVRHREENLDKLLKDLIRNEVYQKGNEILDTYRTYIKDIEENLQISDFNFGAIKDLKKNNFDDIKTVSETVTSTEKVYEERTRVVRNPDHHRFLFWTWGGPKYIEKTEKVVAGEEKYVDREAFIDDIVQIRVNGSKNVEALLDETSSLIEEFKLFFAENISQYNATIDVLLNELEAEIEQETQQNRSKEQHEHQLKELESYMQRVNCITEM